MMFGSGDMGGRTIPFIFLILAILAMCAAAIIALEELTALRKRKTSCNKKSSPTIN